VRCQWLCKVNLKFLPKNPKGWYSILMWYITKEPKAGNLGFKHVKLYHSMLQTTLTFISNSIMVKAQIPCTRYNTNCLTSKVTTPNCDTPKSCKEYIIDFEDVHHVNKRICVSFKPTTLWTLITFAYDIQIINSLMLWNLQWFATGILKSGHFLIIATMLSA